MKYVPDHTGRFDRRPHFDTGYLDELCEKVLFDHAVSTIGAVQWPFSTDSLTTLIERDTESLELYTDMSTHDLDPGVEGFTVFSSDDSKPSIYINEQLSSHSSKEVRLRTTLAHEYGHVLLHAPLFRAGSPCKLLRPPDAWERPIPRSFIQRASSTDWMEWQANYAMGALLMPRSAVHDLADWYGRKYGFRPPFAERTGHAQDLVKNMSKQFFVSQDAALIRLKHMYFIKSS
jgi:Zn-dependent peptidase ImmA (M78 family)